MALGIARESEATPAQRIRSRVACASQESCISPQFHPLVSKSPHYLCCQLIRMDCPTCRGQNPQMQAWCCHRCSWQCLQWASKDQIGGTWHATAQTGMSSRPQIRTRVARMLQLRLCCRRHACPIVLHWTGLGSATLGGIPLEKYAQCTDAWCGILPAGTRLVRGVDSGLCGFNRF